MTLETPPALDIEPATDGGTGLTVPVAKALSHLMIVYAAITREWPITVEAASAEIGEAVGHLRDLVLPRDLITEELSNEFVIWTTSLNNESSEIARTVFTNPEAPVTEAQTDNLKSLVQATWRLLALIDREITGLEPANADPGRTP